ncbi:hypothetical protein ACLB2K_014319 [Fragaria x ananassa]
MSNSKFGRFSYGGDSFIMCLSSSTKYDDMCVTICLKFQNLKVGQYVLKYSLTDLPNCRLDSDEDIAVMMEIFEVSNSRFINIQIFDVGSSSSTSIVPSTVVMSATVSMEASFDDGDVSSDDSNCEDDSNMILGNFVSDKMKRKYMSSEWNDYIFRIGQFFTSGAVEFRDKLCKYAVENGFQFRYTKNGKSRISAKKKRDKVVNGILTRDILDYLKQDFGFEVAYHTTYRGKDAANRSLHGDEGIGYGYLPWYLEAVKRTNHGFRCVLDTQDGRFRRLFIAYRASLHGFQYCPPILFVDETFIKNKYKGMLLGAYAKTGNKGLLNDIKEVFPSSPHSYCIKHLKDNLFGRLSKKLPASYRDTLVSSFAACAYARTHEKFDEAMQKLRSDGVRVHTMNLFTRRRLDSSNWGSVLCPKMEKKLLKRLQTGRSWRVSQSNQDVFEVFTETCNVMVNLAVCECSCRHWEFRCFPYAHAVQVMNKTNLLAYDCIEDYWKTTFYKKTYKLPICPVPDLDRPNILSFGDSTLQPPKTRRSPGRPKSRRIRSFGEQCKEITCSRCHTLGHHNNRTCTNPI